MPQIRLTFPIVVLLTLGCGNPTAPAWEDLLGHWVTPPEDLSPAGWYQTHLQLSPKGTMVYQVRTYGLNDQPREQLSAFSRIEGTYRIQGDRLILNPKRLVWWDSFYGPTSPVHTEPYTATGLLDDARYTLDSGRLTIEYVSYPADAPVATLVHFTR